MKKIRNKKGFTLFELLVSISIVAILTAVAVVSFGGMNKKTRDARRSSDMEKIRVALEAARQVGSTYPNSLNALVSGKFLDKIPTDPKGVGVSYYKYGTGASGLSYYLCTMVELPGAVTSNIGTSCSTGFSLASGFTGYYMVVQP
ncbi:MAG: type II secretion system GspH family protein [Candidatus Shapirobacteria bacterium]|nr:type II secretion system GspH family protein [Candidatus Shapirobacteria bacterium]